MSKGAIVLVLLGIIIIAFPQIIAYALGGLLLALGIFIFIGTWKMENKQKGKDYFRFGEYKIYKNNK